MKLCILDTFASAGTDLSYSRFEHLAPLVHYERSAYGQIVPRIGSSELVITNKCLIDRAVMEQCPNLQYIGVTATGYNNIDLAAATDHGITVTNVTGYSSSGVAQLTFAYILDALNMVREHDARVKAGEWETCPDFCFYDSRLREAQGKALGIVGYGSIARQVAGIAGAFGMQVLVYTRTVPQGKHPVTFVSLAEMLERSDIVTVHCPLTPETEGMFGAQEFAKMKPGGVFINTSRGPVVEEQALADALDCGHLSRAYADVVSAEPIKPDNPLLHAKNMILTPHIAWAAQETRERLIALVYENLRAYLSGCPVNVVNPPQPTT